MTVHSCSIVRCIRLDDHTAMMCTQETADTINMLCAVWVWCGDKAGCKEHYRECWLKHLVMSCLISASDLKSPHLLP